MSGGMINELLIFFEGPLDRNHNASCSTGIVLEKDNFIEFLLYGLDVVVRHVPFWKPNYQTPCVPT